jgi:hypothetical protein
MFMTAVAAKLLQDFQSLAPEEQLLVREHVVSMPESVQRQALERLRGASEGKKLVARLLEDRAGEGAGG